MAACYFITGGVGFLGCHLASELLKRGAKVRTFDIMPLQEPGLTSHVDHCVGDVRDEGALEKSLRGADRVIHAAAALPLASSKEIFGTNVMGTRNVLNASKKAGVERVVFISSTAVYGVPKKHPIFEHDPKIGVGPYGHSKILAEKIVYAFRQKCFIAPIIRPKTFIGTGRLGVFQILFDWIRKGARIPMIGRGHNRYQLLDVSDLVSAILLVSEADSKIANDDFNVGADRFNSVREDLEALCAHTGTASKVLSLPARPVKIILKILEKLKLSPLYQWVYDTADKDSFVSIDKISNALSWKPKYSNSETLIRTYDWYQDHAKDYEGLYGTTHKVLWKQGALSIVRKILGG